MGKAAVDYIRKFITGLELPPVNTKLPDVYRPEARAFASNEQGAAVDAGSLVSFVGGISGLHKSDVLNSTLLAQLAATKQYDRYTQTRQWYEFYTNVLANVGWVMPGFVYRRYEPSGSSLILSDAVIKILSAIATGDEMKVVMEALSGLRDNPNNEGPLVLFDHQSFPEQLGTFQVFPVSVDRGDVVMALAALEFQAEKHVTRFLWWSWTSMNVKLFESAQKGVLNEDIYSQVRQDVIDKLGDNAKKFIHDIEI